MARIGAKLKKLLGPDSVARQFFVWNVLGQVVSSAANPFFIQLTNTVNSAFPVVPLSPPELATMVARGRLGMEQGISDAKKSGVSEGDFRLLVINAQNIPALGDALRLMREGKIPRETVLKIIEQSGYRDEWAPTILKLAVQPPTPEMMLQALLQGQVDEATAKTLYERLGGDPDYFTILYNTQGAAPTPVQSADMAMRGIIPWEGTGPNAVSYHQAFLEGPWRNKWLDAFRKAAEYLPPPDTIVEMIRTGAMSNAQATGYLRQQGVPENMVHFYLAKAVTHKVAKVKDLTESTISTLYQDQAITDPQATDMLKALDYGDEEAKFILLTWRLSRELKARNAAISTVHSQFIAFKIDAGPASLLLDQFRVPATQRDSLIAIWTQERKAKVATLTAAQIRTAVNREVIPEADGVARLTKLGYSQQDAVIFLQL
jgi:hypothetical protein